MKKHTAFTLIEVITVLVIIGLLAAIALPNVFSQIERHRAQEAINTLGAIRQAMESCGASQTTSYDFTNCNSWLIIALTNPSYDATTNPGAHFTYDPFTTAPGNGTYTIVATRANPTISANTVTITRASTGQVTCTGAGAYSGFC